MGLEFSDPLKIGAKELISGYTSYVQDMSSTDEVNNLLLLEE